MHIYVADTRCCLYNSRVLRILRTYRYVLLWCTTSLQSFKLVSSTTPLNVDCYCFFYGLPRGELRRFFSSSEPKQGQQLPMAMEIDAEE